MANPRAPVNTVCLPVFAGYTQFALWPAPQLVSQFYLNHLNISSHTVYNMGFSYFITFQNHSCYGLLDVNTILTPIPTGQYVELVYFPGLQYVAYRAGECSQVVFFLLLNFQFML